MLYRPKFKISVIYMFGNKYSYYIQFIHGKNIKKGL